MINLSELPAGAPSPEFPDLAMQASEQLPLATLKRFETEPVSDEASGRDITAWEIIGMEIARENGGSATLRLSGWDTAERRDAGKLPDCNRTVTVPGLAHLQDNPVVAGILGMFEEAARASLTA